MITLVLSALLRLTVFRRLDLPQAGSEHPSYPLYNFIQGELHMKSYRNTESPSFLLKTCHR
jgi:hypothetical protein